MAGLDDAKLAIDGTDAAVPSAAAVVKEPFDYAKRAQWLRAAVLGTNDGLVSTASLMMGVGAVKSDARAMVMSGFAGPVAGACSMAIGEFVSVYSQYDIELAQIKRDEESGGGGGGRSGSGSEEEYGALPSPLQAAGASALAFSVGAVVPLLAAGFIGNYRVRVGVVAGSASAALAVFGAAGSVLGHAPVGRSCARVVVGGWAAMAVTFAVMKLFQYSGL